MMVIKQHSKRCPGASLKGMRPNDRYNAALMSLLIVHAPSAKSVSITDRMGIRTVSKAPLGAALFAATFGVSRLGKSDRAPIAPHPLANAGSMRIKRRAKSARQ